MPVWAWVLVGNSGDCSVPTTLAYWRFHPAERNKMGDPLKSLRWLLNMPISHIVLKAAPPFVEVKFDKSELQALVRDPDLVSDIVATCFIRRRVFWEDIRKEDRDAVVKSLVEVESDLDDRSSRLASSTVSSVTALTKFVRAWANGASLVRKELKDRLRDIDEEKATTLGYDWANEDRYQAMHDALVSLRKQVYPIVGALVAFLPDDDPTKRQAQDLLDRGLNLIPDAALQRGCVPEFDEM